MKKTFFDLFITTGIITTALSAVILINLHSNLYLAIFLLLLSTIIFYGSFIEPKLLIFNKCEINLKKINQPITIAFISDLHADFYKGNKWIQKIVNKIIDLKPDLVFIGGDQINNEAGNLKELTYLKSLEQLSKQIPTYAINGNHEYGVSCHYENDKKSYNTGDLHQETRQAFEKMDIKYLVNDLIKINIKNQKFYLFGGDSYWAKKLDYSILKNRIENIPTIALIHNPATIFQIYKYNIDLLLSGHTHNGQIRLPFIGPLARVDKIFPKKWYKGIYEYKNTKFLVTNGVGETGTRARLFTPPEIVLLTIK